MIEPFQASRAKLDRAAHHLRDLTMKVEDYLASEPCEIIVGPFPFGDLAKTIGTRAWIARIRKPVPLELSAIIGDTVHNLRSALDLLACDLVQLAGHSTKSVYFPFCDVAEDLSDTIKKRNLHKAGADVVELVKSLKPYKGGYVVLRAIHEMDIADKHQALLPVLGAVTLPVSKLLPGIADDAQIANFSSLIVKDEQMIVGLPAITGSPALGTKLPARISLTLTDVPGIGNYPLVECLEKLTEAADGVFEALTALRPGAVFPSSPKRS